MRNRYVLLGDLPLIAIAAFGAFALRFDWLFLHYRPEFVPFLLLVLVTKPLIFFAFGMYTRYWRYATANDLLTVWLAVFTASLVMTVCVGVGRALDVTGDFSRPVLLIDWLLTLSLVGGLRMSIRVRRRSQRQESPREEHRRGQRVCWLSAPAKRARWWCARCGATRSSDAADRLSRRRPQQAGQADPRRDGPRRHRRARARRQGRAQSRRS